jgi:hypothetical protein
MLTGQLSFDMVKKVINTKGLEMKNKRFSLLMLPLAVVLLSGFISPAAHAQTVTTVTAGSSGEAVGYEAGLFGSLSKYAIGAGQTISALYDSFTCGPLICAGQSVFSVSGFTANPGQAWLSSIDVVDGTRPDGKTLTGAGATSYTYASGVATWHWSGSAVTVGLGFISGTTATATITLD